MKAKLFQFGPVMFAELFKQGAETKIKIVEYGLPPDAVITGFHHDISNDTLFVRVESETFEDILSGNKLPVSEPIIMREIT